MDDFNLDLLLKYPLIRATNDDATAYSGYLEVGVRIVGGFNFAV